MAVWRKEYKGEEIGSPLSVESELWWKQSAI